MGARLPLFGWVINLIVAVPERIMIGTGRSCRSGQALNTSVLTETSMPAPRLPQDLPSVAYLRECLAYAPDTGVLTWKERPREHFASSSSYRCFLARWTGKPAGALSKKGYLLVGINGTRYLIHRVAWAIHYGVWPGDNIDHINGVKDDNRAANLRDVDHATNGLGLVRSRANTSGFTGVTWHRQVGKWKAQIVFKGKNHHLGLYADIDNAIAARKAANLRFGFAETHGQPDPCKVSTASPGRLVRDNTSGHVGVYLVKPSGRWTASIYIKGKLLALGTFKVKEEAVAARKAAEIQYGVADRTINGSGAIIKDPPA